MSPSGVEIRLSGVVRAATACVLWIAAFVIAGTLPVQAATFTVNSLGDGSDANAGNGTCETSNGNGVCTLRAAIEETNNNGVPDTIAFSIPTGGFSGGVGTIAIGSTLQITESGTTIDGTTQALNQTDTNPGMLGSSERVGVGIDGVAGTLDETPLPQVAAPEIEIVESGTLTVGLDIRADNTTIRGIAIYGFGATGATSQTGGDITVGVLNVVGYSNITITECVIGTSARSWSDPLDASRTRTSNIQLYDSDGQITNNLIGFSRISALRVWNAVSPSWVISGNEFRAGAFHDQTGDCVDMPRSRELWIHDNLIHECGGAGLDNWTDVPASAGQHTIEDNTIRDNGTSSDNPFGSDPEWHGLRVFGVGNVIRRNVIADNNGSGVFLTSSSEAAISLNSIRGNGAGGGVGIDLNLDGQNDQEGQSPFYSLNDIGDADDGGNDVQNFPVIDTAFISGTNLIVTGFAPAGSAMQLFLADPDPSLFGQGETWLLDLTESLNGDSDAFVGGYSGSINGVDQGTENAASRFAYSIPIASLSVPVAAGQSLTATATLSSKTSEFGGVAPIPAAPGPAVCTVDPLGTFIEAERFTGTIVQGAPLAVESSLGGFTGSAYLRATAGGTTSSPVEEGKEYEVYFDTTGFYTFWVRGYALDGGSNSLHIGVDGVHAGAIQEATRFHRWVWTDTVQLTTNQIEITSTGLHKINIWSREGDFRVDALYLTQGTETPAGGIPAGAPTLDPLTCGGAISGTVFEDVNYGGGAGRSRALAAADAPSFSIGRPGVAVELYSAAGAYLGSTTTDAGGNYTLGGLTDATYIVRVVNASVSSSRPGSDLSELATQVYRPDGVSESPGDGAEKVGGERPSHEDAAANSGAQTLASLQGTDVDTDSILEWTQSIVSIAVSGSEVTGVDFGFNFDTIVNTNDAGQGSLRQFILNSNLLN